MYVYVYFRGCKRRLLLFWDPSPGTSFHQEKTFAFPRPLEYIQKINQAYKNKRLRSHHEVVKYLVSAKVVRQSILSCENAYYVPE